MVNGQLRAGGIVDQAVLAAFLGTPRERFVVPAYASLAYVDRELPALGAKARRLLAPMTLARMLQAAMVNPGDRALDVGGGSGYGAALLDAMGAGICVLTSDIPENREVVGGSGFTFRAGNVDDLARMLGLLLSDPQMRASSGRNAQQVIRERYLWPRIAKEIAEVYEEILGRHLVVVPKPVPRTAKQPSHLRTEEPERVA